LRAWQQVAKAGSSPRIRLARCQSQAASGPTSTANVRTFLEAASASNLGKVRFIVMGQGAILESVAEWKGCKYTDIPGKGTLATISTPDKSFECHLYISQLKTVKLAKSQARGATHDVYGIRFTGAEGQMLLTCVLHGNAGQYEPQALAAWQQLAQEFGSECELTDSA